MPKKRFQRTREFCIGLTPEVLNKPYRLFFRGHVHYWEYPPDPSADSDIDYRGYNEYIGMDLSYIVMETPEEDEIFLRESDVERNDYELFASRLNILCEF